MSTPTKNKRTSRKPSQTARILETVELLLALHEEQGNQQSESQGQVELLTEQLAGLESKISCMADNRGESVPMSPNELQQQVQQAIDERLDQFLDRQIEKLNEAIGGQLETRLEDLFDRFEKLEQQSSAVRSQLTNLETQAVFGGTSSDTSAEPPAEWMGKIEDKLESSSRSLLSDVELRLDEFYDRLTTRLGSAPTVAKENLNPQVAPSDDDSASHWEKQKRAMLQKYGIDPEKRPLEEEKKREQEEKAKQASAAEKLNSLHDSIANISPEDSEAIEKLKKDLNSKLRDAEVELSINRAKLSQERAELDQQRTELEQRMADLEAKLASRDQNPEDKKGGFMNRFTRHLGK